MILTLLGKTATLGHLILSLCNQPLWRKMRLQAEGLALDLTGPRLGVGQGLGHVQLLTWCPLSWRFGVPWCYGGTSLMRYCFNKFS